MMAIKLNQSQHRSGRQLVSSTAERRVKLAETIIGKLDNRSHCDPHGNAVMYATANAADDCSQSEDCDQVQDYSVQAIHQLRASENTGSFAACDPVQERSAAVNQESIGALNTGTVTDCQQAEASSPESFDYSQSAADSDDAFDREAGNDGAFDQCHSVPVLDYSARSRADAKVTRTTEFLRQPMGTLIKPHYDRSGILIRIEFSDGCSFSRAKAQTPWLVLDQNGQAVEGVEITSVSIDCRGNVVYILHTGEKSVIHVDGAMS